MVWPFSSGSSGGSDASSVVSSALAIFRATKASVEEVAATATDAIPVSMKPYILTATAFGVSASVILFYRTRLRRIPTAAYLTPNLLNGKRILRGKVTSVGDADNFRFYHTPGGFWAGWGWLRHVPTDSKALKDKTIHIRIAGVDAPEASLLLMGDSRGAHFGMPAQPFSHEALTWLRSQVNGKTVLIQLYSKDRYERVVSMAWYPRSLPFLPMKNVSAEMLKVGYGQIYRQAGSQYGGMLSTFEKLEAEARAQKIGIWSQKNMVSAAEHKKQHLRGKD
ncbi:putative endonuclease lcl3 [Mortierella sp. GBA43]|nr:putative endonuclease lcl3 [Mortierella sp. GBA43]